MGKYFLLSILGIVLLSCSNDDDNSQNTEFVGKTFDYLFFETEQECIDAQTDPNFFINCHQELSFVDNENVEILFTDIKYSANYKVGNNKIVIYSSSNILEFQNDIIFEIINDSSLKFVDNNTIWKLRTGNSIWN
ncbi:hypothetical protein [Aquimarina megaterium]|uniref:hypothetical protein n=1 Tax=Aquimarina megaterium TaxID=1443666 RepID=UPI0004718F38|nr:hypothetical protein [Aquimarina megaterium]